MSLLKIAIAACSNLSKESPLHSSTSMAVAPAIAKSPMPIYLKHKPYYSKTSCKPEDTTREQMADKSRITNDEKVALSKVRTEVTKFNKERDEIFRQYTPELAPSVIARRQQASNEQDSISEDFSQGRI